MAGVDLSIIEKAAEDAALKYLQNNPQIVSDLVDRLLNLAMSQAVGAIQRAIEKVTAPPAPAKSATSAPSAG